MSTHAANRLVECLRECPLLEAAQFDELERDLAARFPNPRELARELLRRGWLTPFQVNQIAAGKSASLILDQYVLLDLLGEGGMGAVYKARQRRVKRDVALKLIRPEALKSPGAVERFRREAEAAAQLSHPNIVTLFDVNEVNGTPFLVMELIDGTDLARLVQEQGPLPVARACDYIRQAALGLQHAHEHGLVHRDIKPHNLMVTRDDIVKVMDLGLALLIQDEHSATLTQVGAFMGTPAYMAPEQGNNAHQVDIRADIYSLGCTLFHLLAGRPPFGGETPYQVFAGHLQAAPPLEQLRDRIPSGLEMVLRRMMAKRPEDRFSTPAEVAQALQPWAGSSGTVPVPRALPIARRVAETVAGRPSPVVSTQFEGEQPKLMPARQKRRKQSAPRHRWLAVGAILAAVVLLSGGGLVAWRMLRSPAPSVAAADPLVLDLGGSKLQLVRIQQGSFFMGSPDSDKDAEEDEKPQHEVTISRDFLLGKFTVTRGQFAQFVQEEDYHTDAEKDDAGSWGYQADENKIELKKKYTWRDLGFPQTDEHPVVNVSWNDAVAFCAWASKKSGRKVELPTEAQWEYAARAQTTTRYFTGDDPVRLQGYANVADQTLKAQKIKGYENWDYLDFSDGYAFTAPVGSFKANPWGLHDMTGNVWQWCADGRRPYTKDKGTDVRGPEDDSARVLRGGCMFNRPLHCRIAKYFKYAATHRSFIIGFRVGVRLD